MRKPRGPNHYEALKAEQDIAREPVRPGTPPEQAPTSDQPLTSEALHEAFEREQTARFEAGKIDRQELGYRMRRFEDEQRIKAQFEGRLNSGGDQPTLSAAQLRQAELSPTKTVENERTEAMIEKVSRSQGIDDRAAARMARLLERSSDEREMRFEQEIGDTVERTRGR